MTILDFNKDGHQELIVGSDDFQIRVFQNEEIITEITETEKVTKLKALGGNKYGYGLANGTVGVYEGTERVWRGKTKHELTSLESFDLDGDGVNEVACGWGSGKFEVRSDKTGEVIYRDTFASSVAGIVTADYRGDGSNQIICVSSQGEVRAYTQAPPELRGNLMGKRVDEEVLKDLNQQKQQLLQELHNYESNLAVANKPESGVIPKTTQILVALEMNPKEKCIDLLVSTNNPEAIIRGVILVSEQIFSNESFVHHPSKSVSEVKIPLTIDKNIQSNLAVKVIVGARGNNLCHVFESTQKLPKFSMFVEAQSNAHLNIPSYVAFSVGDKLHKVAQWMVDSFIVEQPPQSAVFEATFLSLRDGKPLVIETKNNGEILVRVDDMEVAGDIVQDICATLLIEDMESVAHFPEEMKKFEESLTNVSEYNVTRSRLTAEMADNSNLIKTLVIKAEDARLLGEITVMKKAYGMLFDLNKELIGEYKKRVNNFEALLGSLKEVNQMIQKASRLRGGNVKTRVTYMCRVAIRANNTKALFNIIRTGKE